MTLLGVKFTEPYSSKHIGIDVKAPIGTPLRSPGNCKMLQMYIGKDGTQAVHISCKEFPGIEIELGHIDFQLGDSITYFAIPSTYFTNNKPVKNSFGYFPENKSFKPGESLHIYTASTGNSGYPHLHITVWTRPNNEWNPNNDPENFLKCR